MRKAADYEAYHEEDDTIQKIIDEAGSETNFEQGSENTLKSVYYTALAIDNHLPVPEGTVSSNGLTVNVDASGSSDPDAAPTGFTWDFGDGTTAMGATATHRYDAPGTYTVELTVVDNLWSQVTRSKTFSVTVG
jgi:PKD repeat protein